MVEPLTEQRPVPGLFVCGYLHAVRISSARRDSLTGALATYCVLHELHLVDVFTERDDDRSTSYAHLLDLLTLPATYGMVVPTLSHLGPGGAVVAARAQEVKAAGARLLTVRTNWRP
ncbi:hypothetical protein [Nonomuraea typhae]|uniref:Recombinase family protein n=1 Tax=Nonomuraea typhae TaxID=2603600 RepID=A0ABW7Z8P2_9ACTN